MTTLAGILLVGLALWDIFHTMVLPRTFASSFRLTHLFYQLSWPAVRFIVSKTKAGRLRESILASYGPLSLIGLIFCWTVELVVGFGLVSHGLDPSRSIGRDLYLSGTTFFTLGLGDERPLISGQRVLAVVEAGIGFGTLAIVIGYLPVLYQAFARRELEIALLASRAGSPSTAAGLLTRLARHPSEDRLIQTLHDYERWCAEIMENHSSYPMLAFYRSQHERQSWLGSLTMLLDSCALLQVGFESHPQWRGPVEDQAELTFSMGLRAMVKLSGLLRPKELVAIPDRLPPAQFVYLRKILANSGMNLRSDDESRVRFKELRELYEPHVSAIASHLELELPPFVVQSEIFESTTPEVAVRDVEES